MCKNAEIQSFSHPIPVKMQIACYWKSNIVLSNSSDTENVSSIALLFSYVPKTTLMLNECMRYICLPSSDVQKTDDTSHFLPINIVVVFTLFIGFPDQILSVLFRSSIFLGFTVLQLTLRAEKHRTTSILRLQ